MQRPIVAVFDFDVTITTKDTFFPFLVCAFGRLRVYLTCMRLVPDALRVAVGISDRDRFKERIVWALFKGQSVEHLQEIANTHAVAIERLFRPAALRRISWHKGQGHRLVIVSASLDLYLTPVAKKLGFDDLLCTTLSRNHFVFDGYLEGANCRGPEKVRRLTTLLGDLAGFELHIYGDSSGDLEMLAVADYPHFRLF